jgi:hypothetical protein
MILIDTDSEKLIIGQKYPILLKKKYYNINFSEVLI